MDAFSVNSFILSCVPCLSIIEWSILLLGGIGFNFGPFKKMQRSARHKSPKDVAGIRLHNALLFNDQMYLRS